MDSFNLKGGGNYKRVMSTASARGDSSKSNRPTSQTVTRHGKSKHIDKHSRVASSFEFPLVLDNLYESEVDINDTQMKKRITPHTFPIRNFRSKPKKTLTSLVPSPKYLTSGSKTQRSSLQVRSDTDIFSRPSFRNVDSLDKSFEWSDTHMKECSTSKSHLRVSEIKSEIQKYREKEKLVDLKTRLYNKCGLMLDESGLLRDKSIQVSIEDINTGKSDCQQQQINDHRSEKREDDMNPVKMVNAATQNQDVQVNFFPIDRYLNVHQPDLELSSLFSIKEKKCAFSAQDELLLKNLQNLLQSTAEELQVLSKQLTQRTVQAASHKLPKTEVDIRRKHAQKIVDAKFCGVKPGEKAAEKNGQEKLSKINDITTKVSSKKSHTVQRKDKSSKSVKSPLPKEGKSKNVSVQTSYIKEDTDEHLETKHKAMDLKTKDTVSSNIDERNERNNTMKQFMVKEKYIDNKKISIGYVEILKGEEVTKSKTSETVKKINKLEIQPMPSINIKTELTAQKIPSLEIKPLVKDIVSKKNEKSNTVFIEYQYVEPAKHSLQNTDSMKLSPKTQHSRQDHMKTVRPTKSKKNDLKISQSNVVKLYKEAFDFLQKSQLKEGREKSNGKKKDSKQTNTVHEVISEKWKTKRKQLHAPTPNPKLTDKEKSDAESIKLMRNPLTGTDYIPYSKLTLGGVKVTEIEKELSSISKNKADIPLSPIVDKILSSAENSLSSEVIGQSKTSHGKTSGSSSDENLSQDVLSLEKEMKKMIQEDLEKSDDRSKSIEKNEIMSKTFTRSKSTSDSDKTNNTYDDDDFEEELDGSPNNSDAKNNSMDEVQSHSGNKNIGSDGEHVMENNPENLSNSMNNLSLKNNIDIFEFLHRVTSRDSATQVRANNTVSLKETQTTPRDDTITDELNILPNMISKAKSVSFDDEYIKNLVKEECGNFASSKEIASFSKSTETEHSNIVKNVQTSPMHVKHTMTSPLHVANKSTSPFDIISDEARKKPTKNELQEDIISLNLSSPRFQLKLPQSSYEVLSNLNSAATEVSLDDKRNNLALKHKDSLHKENRQVTKTSSDSCGDDSATDISSLGEISLKLLSRKFSRKNRTITTSESSTTSNVGSSVELHCERFCQKTKSDGELSLGQV